MYLDKGPLKERQPGDPPLGDVGWLWYRPGNGMRESLFPAYASFCGRCDVFDVQDMSKNTFRCWNCGKFLPRPRTWSPYRGFTTNPRFDTPAPSTEQPTLDEALDG